MKKKRILSLILTVSMAGALLAGCGSADQETGSSDSVSEAAIEESEEEILDISGGTTFTAPEKSETVTVSADASGNVTKISSAVTLSGFDAASGDFIEDISNLTEVKNKEGEEEFLQEGDVVYWQNLGDKVSYEGESENELPLSVKVTYYLDGEEKTPEEMAGASGEFRIRFDFESNLSGEYIPFLAVPAVMMSENHFSDVEVSKGKVISMGDNQVALGYCIPGIGDYLDLDSYDLLEDKEIDFADSIEITGQTDDFELDMTAVIVKNGIFGELEDEDLDDIDDLADGLTEIGDAGDDLESAAGELVSGVSDFHSYLSQYVSGVNSLASGISQLNSSLSGMDTAAITAEIQAGMAAEQAAVEAEGGTYDASTSQYAQLLALVQGLDQIKSGVSELNTGAKQLSSSGSSLLSGYQSLEDGISEFSDAINELNDEGLSDLSDKGSDVASILDKIRTLKANDLTYDNYSGKTEGQDTSVTFIIECEGIEK